MLRDPPPPVDPAAVDPEDEARGPVVPPPPAPDLVRLLADPEPQLRRRAALALGRVGLPEGAPPLVAALGDPEPEVRQMAAFGLGLIGDTATAGALVAALDDPMPIVQGRAAEALGRIGAVDRAPAIAAMVRRHFSATFQLDPEDQTYPLAAPVEAFRLGLYALAELGAYEPLAAVVLQPDGQPIVWWWPVAYALQRTGDPRAAVALTTLAGVQGSVGVAFAARGLGALGDPAAIEPLAALLDPDRRDGPVMAAAARALGRIDDPRAAEALRRLALTRDLARDLRVVVLDALAAQSHAEAEDLFIELMAARWPPLRAAALRGLARSDPATLVRVLSGLGADPEWHVRAALADGLLYAPVEAAAIHLRRLLGDEEPRVIPSALRAVAHHRLPDSGALLLAQLEHPDAEVRATAARLLGRVDPLPDLEVPAALARAYDRARLDSTYRARAGIIEALARIGGPAAAATLTDALDDADWAVRVAAAAALRSQAGGAETEAAIRPAPGRNAVDFRAPRLVRPPVSPRVYVETGHGTIELQLNVVDAPITADNFAALARRGFYDGLTFHRVVPHVRVAGGDPRRDGTGGPGYTIRDERNQVPFLRGTVGMARDAPDTAGSRFFITLSPDPQFDGRHTAFATVVAGMDVVDRLEPGDVIRRVLVWDGSGTFGAAPPAAGR